MKQSETDRNRVEESVCERMSVEECRGCMEKGGIVKESIDLTHFAMTYNNSVLFVLEAFSSENLCY